MKKSLLAIPVIIAVIISVSAIFVLSSENDANDSNIKKYPGHVAIQGDLFMILYQKEILKNPIAEGGQIKLETQPLFAFIDSKKSTYNEIGNLDKNQNTIFVYPTFTQSAYKVGGFYDYFNGQCDKACLSIEIFNDFEATASSSGNAAVILSLLGYEFVTDIDVDKDPSILDKYDKVILLHNEYVTKKMFDAVTSHPKVIYLYPNALYAEIETDYQSNTMTLIRGHAYPEQNIDNGFDWKFDNTRPDEFDTECLDWKFREIDNGIQLNCYPENIIYSDSELLKQIKNYN